MLEAVDEVQKRESGMRRAGGVPELTEGISPQQLHGEGRSWELQIQARGIHHDCIQNCSAKGCRIVIGSTISLLLMRRGIVLRMRHVLDRDCAETQRMCIGYEVSLESVACPAASSTDRRSQMSLKPGR